MLTEKFKKQCAEYNDFMNELEKLTNDFCKFYEKNNPFSSNSKNESFEINEDFIYISWQEEQYSCGWETEYYNITIPLNFYEKIDLLKLEKINLDEQIDNLKKDQNSLINKKRNIISEISSIKKDFSSLDNLKKKYNISFDEKSFKDKDFNLNKELIELNEKISLLGDEIERLEYRD